VTQQDEGNSSVTHTSVSVDYAALGGGTLFAAKLAPASHTSPGSRAATSGQRDGTRVYSAAATPKSCVIMNGPDLAILGYLSIDAAPNVERSTAASSAAAPRTGGNDIYMYDSAGKVCSSTS
jgi:hypothetical protein